ncbi:MAG: OsmC family protein [Candidatus Eisenbacteria bacterium]|nr:OsmC family protein [Candidatus Eisenbacteria bacterium]
MKTETTLRLATAAGTSLRFDAQFPKHSITLDSGPEPTAPSPMHHLLAAIGGCAAMDVISILRKKRLQISAYEVELEAERAETHPKRLLSVTLVHRVTGRGVPLAAVEESVRLSAERYCSVRHTLDPAMPMTDRCEVIEG